MLEILFYIVLLSLVVVATFLTVAAVVGSVNLVSRSSDGYLNFYFYAILLKQAVDVLLSGRTLASDTFSIENSLSASTSGPLAIWVTRGVSLLLLLAATERIVSYRVKGIKGNATSLLLIASFIGFWGCTVLSPALFSSHRNLSHEYIYPLVLAISGLLTSYHESNRALDSFRNGALVFILLGLLVIPIRPGLVMDLSYSQGLIPGLPRLAGIAPHAVFLGMLSELCMFCLWARPLSRKGLNRGAWIMCLIVLFLAQSKTTWISFVICSIGMWIARHGENFKRRFNDHRHPAFGIVVLLIFLTIMMLAAATLIFGDISEKMIRFLASDEGAQLSTFTGRDKIWAIAFEEWHRNPIFGYGPSLFDGAFQLSIGMSNATHGHNQFVDTLARAGIVGATGLVAYASILLVLSLRYSKSSGGLTLALFLALAIRSISEVPLIMFGYNFEFLGHILLLIILSGEIRRKIHNADSKPARTSDVSLNLSVHHRQFGS